MPERPSRPKAIRCPTCGVKVDSGKDAFPFCSDRCREIDLGNWFEEKYKVPFRQDTDDEDAHGDGASKEPNDLEDSDGRG